VKTITLKAHGGPEQLQVQNSPSPVAGPNQVLVKVNVVGVNFMDTGVRSGILWRDKPLPLVPGVEGAGRILALGDGVETFQVGDRVAWVYAPGSYTEQLVAAADALVPLPDTIDDEIAAAVMMQGVTASHLATQFYAVRPGDIALVHAAAGGVGTLLTQIVKLRGGTVIARVSSREKVEIAREAGAGHVIVERGGSFLQEILGLTDGRGVDVVFDGSGATTFDDSLASLHRHGVLAYYGPVLGAPKPINIAALPRSILIGFPIFSDHIATRNELLDRTRQLFDWIESGELKVKVGKRYPMSEAAQAHVDIESRRSVRKLVLIP
jgi:NADPH2:quinone reductase